MEMRKIPSEFGYTDFVHGDTYFIPSKDAPVLEVGEYIKEGTYEDVYKILGPLKDGKYLSGYIPTIGNCTRLSKKFKFIFTVLSRSFSTGREVYLKERNLLGTIVGSTTSHKRMTSICTKKVCSKEKCPRRLLCELL